MGMWPFPSLRLRSAAGDRRDPHVETTNGDLNGETMIDRPAGIGSIVGEKPSLHVPHRVGRWSALLRE